jgi:hypothetical protein
MTVPEQHDSPSLEGKATVADKATGRVEVRVDGDGQRTHRLYFRLEGRRHCVVLHAPAPQIAAPGHGRR